jgi:hypothetical protein
MWIRVGKSLSDTLPNGPIDKRPIPDDRQLVRRHRDPDPDRRMTRFHAGEFFRYMPRGLAILTAVSVLGVPPPAIDS